MQYRPVQFPTGEVRATTAALANVSKEKLIRLVNRHIRGDWGDTYMADQKANEQAIRDGERILSWYQISGKIRILIITEADRSATTIMLSAEITICPSITTVIPSVNLIWLTSSGSGTCFSLS